MTGSEFTPVLNNNTPIVTPSISLRDFVATGNFGPVYLGMHKDDVERHLGRPSQWRDKKPTIWKYGGVKMYIAGKGDTAAKNTVSMIFTDDYNSPAAWIDYWVFNPGLTMNDAKISLGREGVPFSEVAIPSLTDNYYLVTESGVYLQFSNYVDPFEDEEQGEPKLVAISKILGR